MGICHNYVNIGGESRTRTYVLIEVGTVFWVTDSLSQFSELLGHCFRRRLEAAPEAVALGSQTFLYLLVAICDT